MDVLVQFTDERRALAFERYIEIGIRLLIREAPLPLTIAWNVPCHVHHPSLAVGGCPGPSLLRGQPPSVGTITVLHVTHVLK